MAKLAKKLEGLMDSEKVGFVEIVDALAEIAKQDGDNDVKEILQDASEEISELEDDSDENEEN